MEKNFSSIFKGDKILWYSIIILAVLSIVAVYSATGALAYQSHDGNTYYFLIRHTSFVAVGIITILLVQFIPYSFYFKIAPYFYVGVLLMLVVTMFVGVNKNGATRWLEIPVIHLQFQPSDFAKLAMIVVTAKILSVNQDDPVKLKQSIRQIVVMTGLMSFMILPSDLSTAVLLVLIVVVILYIGRVQLKVLFAMLGIAIVILATFFIILENSEDKGRLGTWKARYESFIHPEEEGNDNTQINQAKVAIVTGGLIGKGPGNSIQRNVLPQSYSDFIYAFIIEEYGILGAILVLMLYLWILYRGIHIVKKAKKAFPILLALGLIFSMAIQAFMNMAVAVGLVPVTGQTLPFLSMGGTSIVMTGVLFGIILNISRETLREENEGKMPDDMTDNTEMFNVQNLATESQNNSNPTNNVVE